MVSHQPYEEREAIAYRAIVFVTGALAFIAGSLSIGFFLGPGFGFAAFALACAALCIVVVVSFNREHPEEGDGS